MNIVAFPVNSTNIFPIANSHAGGQLVTEFNLRSRESVLTDSSVEYSIGPSYVHSLRDFKVTASSDSDGSSLGSTSSIDISPGRAVINGHYVESLVTIHLDMLDLNQKLVENGETKLSGQLSIGLKMTYSTEKTLSGSLQTEFEDDGTPSSYYRGVQIVIEPSTEFKLPVDVPTDEYMISAHIKLADFKFVGNMVTDVVENEDRIQYISFDRIKDFNASDSGNFVTKNGLDANNLYVIPGHKGDLQNATNALVRWAPYTLPTASAIHSGRNEHARFVIDSNESVQFRLPYLMNEYPMQNAQGDSVYYPDTFIQFPKADFVNSTPGTVSSSYTNAIKAKTTEIYEKVYLKTGAAGSQRGFIDTLYSDSDTYPQLPPIQSTWKLGDYVIVASDQTRPIVEDTGIYPSTMYMLWSKITDFDSGHVYDSLQDGKNIVYMTDYQDTWDVATSDVKSLISSTINRQTGSDYVVVPFYSDDASGDRVVKYAYYKASSNSGFYWDIDHPIYLTGGTSIATSDRVGGFLNMDEDSTDFYGNGYVYADSNGHLRLVDYDLLVTGVLAYQLGEDVTIPGGLDPAETQSLLDQYVNNRVAFTYDPPSEETESSHVAVELNLNGVPDGSVFNIGNIDSRFGTYVDLRLVGSCTYNVIVNVSNCQKLKITRSSECNVTLKLKDVNLYYDSSVLGYQYLTSVSGLQLWALNDDDVYVDRMTVFVKTNRQDSTNQVDFWSEYASNDNIFTWALRSFTFSTDGKIVQLGFNVGSNTTSQQVPSSGVFVYPLTLSSSVPYPNTRFADNITVTGAFVTGYTYSDNSIYMQDVSFTVSAYKDSSKSLISFYSKVALISGSVVGADTLVGTGFEPGSLHYFQGGLVGNL